MKHLKIIITRHGETEENKAGILMGHLHGKLTPLGLEQAKKVALRLKEEKINFIYSSDLARALDTAKEIAKFHPNLNIKTTKYLRERYMGEFQGKKLTDVGWSVHQPPNNIEPKEGETIQQVYERGGKFLHKLLLDHPKNVVLIVGHEGINKALMGNILGKTWEEAKAIQPQHNTSVNIFEIFEDKSHQIHAFNCIKHLET